MFIGVASLTGGLNAATATLQQQHRMPIQDAPPTPPPTSRAGRPDQGFSYKKLQ
jgi:hypothetical protein